MIRGFRVGLGWGVALAITFGAARSARADLHVERGDGADACPDTASFATHMHEGGAESRSDEREIHVRFERTTNGYRSRIRMPDGRSRTLFDDAPSCEGLAEATLLAVKLTLDLETRPPQPPPTRSPPLDAAETTAVPSARSTPMAEIYATSVVTFGLTSPVAPGARAGAAFILGEGRWSLGITGVALPAHTRGVREGTVELSLLGGGVEGCGRLPMGRSLLVALCARVEGTSLGGSSRGFKYTRDERRPLFAGTLLGRGRARLVGPIGAFVEAGAVLPFVRERFSLDTLGVVYDPPVVAAVTGIGLIVDFE